MDRDMATLQLALATEGLAVQQLRLRAEFKRITGLSTTEVTVLYRVGRGGVSAAAIAKATHRSPSTITAAVDSLANRGLIERGTDNLDRRRQVLRLTERGKRWRDLLVDPVGRAVKQEVRSLRDDQVALLAAALVSICAALALEHAPLMAL